MNNKTLSLEQKKALLKIVVDDITYKALKDKDIENEFICNLSNILIQTNGEF